MIEKGDYEAMSALKDYKPATALPFPLNGDSVADLLTAYGTMNEGTYSWIGMNNFLHFTPVCSGGPLCLQTGYF